MKKIGKQLCMNTGSTPSPLLTSLLHLIPPRLLQARGMCRILIESDSTRKHPKKEITWWHEPHKLLFQSGPLTNYSLWGLGDRTCYSIWAILSYWLHFFFFFSGEEGSLSRPLMTCCREKSSHEGEDSWNNEANLTMGALIRSLGTNLLVITAPLNRAWARKGRGQTALRTGLREI